MLSYLIPAASNKAETEVKRSRFISFVKHCNGNHQAKQFIKHIKEQYPDARHHCHAFIAGAPNDSNLYGFSDDGEPNGTAGMPIFKHLKHSDIGEIALVVVRYFGGTKLGTGGLARAYSDAAKSVLKDLKTKDYVKTHEVILSMSFALEDEVRSKIALLGGKIERIEYTDQVKMTISVPQQVELTLPYSVTRSPISTI